ncbi:conserved hypothetical protein [Trichinella spiralis]|uniref:hypothetical protein n=1 Tax=Trichinella spiralis TaxID=6334 RepID=UPI0001EFD5E9|nr:conserved hypothetical protein [Trichinella spiralis]
MSSRFLINFYTKPVAAPTITLDPVTIPADSCASPPESGCLNSTRTHQIQLLFERREKSNHAYLGEYAVAILYLATFRPLNESHHMATGAILVGKAGAENSCCTIRQLLQSSCISRSWAAIFPAHNWCLAQRHS